VRCGHCRGRKRKRFSVTGRGSMAEPCADGRRVSLVPPRRARLRAAVVCPPDAVAGGRTGAGGPPRRATRIAPWRCCGAGGMARPSRTADAAVSHRPAKPDTVVVARASMRDAGATSIATPSARAPTVCCSAQELPPQSETPLRPGRNEMSWLPGHAACFGTHATGRHNHVS
jgi:hypothetical protein